MTANGSWKLELTSGCSCVDSILVNGKGSVYCPGEDVLVNYTSTFMRWALYPGHVNDKG